LADVQPPPTQVSQKQPRTLGQKAVLHVYYYSPKTLEITYVDSYLFKDQEACVNAIGAALQIAMPYAGDGDLVTGKCVGHGNLQSGADCIHAGLLVLEQVG